MRRKGRGHMRKTVLKAVALAAALTPVVGFAQAPKAATYITDEEVKAVNATPGVDRTIKVVDVGPENFAVGVIHRGATGGAARRRGGRGGRGGLGRRRAAARDAGRPRRRSRAARRPRHPRRPPCPGASRTISRL